MRSRARIVALAGLVAAAGASRGSASAASTMWATETSSPRPGAIADPRDEAIGRACGGGIDASLVAVAGDLAEALASKGELPDAQEIEWRQRMHGNPHVWARTWGARAEGSSLDRKALAADVAKWLGPSASRLRCGIASVRLVDSATGLSADALAVIAVDAVADLAPLPVKNAVGTWVDLDTVLLDGATAGRVVLLPPSGAPKTVLSSTTSATPPHVRARFKLPAEGRYVVQVMADDGAGPRPVVEAELYAGIEPPTTPPSSEVPGEALGDGIDDPAEALLRRLNGARSAEGVGAVTLDTGLVDVARAHAKAMLRARQIGHDVGDGDPAARVAAIGEVWKVVGENVAKARSERGAHRALYASPSHRAAMLDPRFTKVGIAAIVEPKTGEVWVAQVFGG